MKFNKEEYQPFIDKTWKELKDFQRDTVEYVYEQLYVRKRDKILVADEVGLGKTIVAKGVIAKAFENFKPTKQNPTFNVVYICSNQALAYENLKKLNFTKQQEVVADPLNRLIFLAFKAERDKTILKFDSLTPATSLNISNRSGSQKERAIIYSLLAHYAPFFKRQLGLKWLLKGNVESGNWDKLVKDYHRNRKEKLKSETFKKFRDILFKEKVRADNMPQLFKYFNHRKDISIWDALMGICRKINHTNYRQFTFKNEIIVCLRHLLTKVCLEYLSADLIILDEFQRYSEILGTKNEEGVSPAIELAQAVFELKNTKVLLLSATPFKPYTTSSEEEKGEDHYQEFKRVLKFLMKKQSEEFWLGFENDRRDFFSKISKPLETLDNLHDAVKLKTRLQNHYKEGIVRTERIKVSDDQNTLIKNGLKKPLQVSASDIEDFILFDKICQALKATNKFRTTTPVEYSKSCPYPFSFLDGYQIKKNLKEMLDDDGFKNLLKDTKTAWINLEEVNQYKPLGNKNEASKVPNAKMQFLLDQLVESDSWKWLWVPPTINYYKPRDIYPEVSNFSKTLIFSSWQMVPKAISTILSYEAERKAIGKYYQLYKEDTPEPYFSGTSDTKKRKPTPILTFKTKNSGEVSSSMSLFTLLYPSKYLAELFDPEQNILEEKSLEKILENLSEKIKDEFYKLKLDRYKIADGEPERWYWAALLLLDKHKFHNSNNFEKLIEELVTHEEQIKSDSYSQGEDITGKNEKIHIHELQEAFSSPEKIGLGEIPNDLFQVLASLCLGSPSICFQRSMQKTLKHSYPECFKESYLFGISKMHFFNKPENIAIVRSFCSGDSGGYWKSVIKYCIEGNLQSTLDEFIHLLIDSGNNLKDIQLFFSDVLMLRTATIKVDDLNSFNRGLTKRMRTNYAVDFGTQNLETDSGTGRVLNVRQAFNSPYRPFVLASTSIGQEGLDFHYYCGKVMHWNLPGNAIDIEQREGRVNRYKGLVIRQNIAKKYLASIQNKNSNNFIWQKLFIEAEKIEGKGKNKCELVPFWHIEPVDDLKIERIIPLYPFSKDIDKFKMLTETLTYYRLTFGQPRQEELIETFQQAGLSTDQVDTLRKYLLIDLSPK